MRPLCSASCFFPISQRMFLMIGASAILFLSSPTDAIQPPLISIEGKVVRVVDGDTVVFVAATGKKMTLRLTGIDAPEKRMAYGDLAKKMLSDRIRMSEVTIQTIKVDRYGRIIAKVLLQEQDVSLWLIREGLAWHYKRYAHEQAFEDAENYAATEEEARMGKRGLWHDPNPVPPWVFRKCHRNWPGCRY